jgi:Rrf2 family protein
MYVSREADYAIRCILHMTREPGSIFVVHEIAGPQGIPRSFLAKILQKLAKAGLVTSVRGIKGGFQLARKPEEITILDVIRGVQGPAALNICVLDSKSCFRSSFCSVHPVWVELQDVIEKKLMRYTMKRLLQEEQKIRNRDRGKG